MSGKGSSVLKVRFDSSTMAHGKTDKNSKYERGNKRFCGMLLDW